MEFINRKRMEFKDESTKMKFLYCRHCNKRPIVKNRVLFESFHGKDISDSSLAIARELLAGDDKDKYEIYFATVEPEPVSHKKFIKSQNLDIKLVYIQSDEYAEILATAQYLVNNSSFPTYFIKRPGQKYLQTWHGTPLKTLGKSMRMGMESMDNIQHNFIQADLIMFPNEFTQQLFMRDYNLERLYAGEIALCGYPRNTVFSDEAKAEEIKKLLGNENRRTIAYMPTWRGQNNYDIETTEYAIKVDEILSRIDETLDEDTTMYVNFHPIVKASVSLAEYRHIEPFPEDVDKYDFLNSTDALVTDYSSVFFDYSITGKPITLFMYDYDQYMSDRGVYFDIKELPFTKVYNVEDMCSIISSEEIFSCTYDKTGEYADKFIKYDSIKNTETLTKYFFNGINDGLRIQDCSHNLDKKWNVIDARRVKSDEMLDRIARMVDSENDIVCFGKRKFSGARSMYMHDHYRDAYTYIFSAGKSPRTFAEDICSEFSSKKIKEFRKRDLKRWLGNLKIGHYITFQQLICIGDVKKITTKGTKITVRVKLYDHFDANKIDRVILKLRDEVDDVAYDFSYHVSAGMLTISIDIGSLDLNGIYWDVKVLYDGKDEEDALLLFMPKSFRKWLKIAVKHNRIGDNVIFPYSGANARLAFICREWSRYDGYTTRIKELVAYLIYRLFGPYFDRKHAWLVFEKFCQMAQDNGYYFFKYCMDKLPEKEKRHIYYVMREDADDYRKVSGYGRNVIKFMSIKHLIYAMAASVDVGSDSKKHLYIWRPKPNMITDRLRNKSMFFLQHGVTALKKVDTLFGMNGSSPMTYFATTSDYEQKIVVENFGYLRERTPVVGFARWDVLVDESREDNNLILVMPTWRSWLEGKTAETFKESDYYENYMKLLTNPQLERILEEHDGKMVFYIHPKFKDYLGNFVVDSKRIELVPFGSKPLNAIMRECRMLITDYSSVCWDVYYLGKPVMFYQFDYEMYMQVHGSYMDMPNELFGERCFDSDAVIAGIKRNLKNGFKEDERAALMRNDYFKYIDNDNSKRTYEYLRKEGF